MSTRAAMTAPPHHLQALEAMWPLEAAAFLTIPMPSFLLPVTESRPVLVLPGFTTSDFSTRPLRQVILQHGHYVHAWKLGQNLGPTERAVMGLRGLIQRLADRHERPIAVVGWSLGGLYARALAREQPDLVSQVITLGSPIRAEHRDRTTFQAVWDQTRLMHRDDLLQQDIPETDRPPLTVPATSIFTKTDGIARWQLCLDEVGPGARNPRAENIEVYGTHNGLGVNWSAAYAVLDRLAQSTDRWRPFEPPPLLSPLYPRSCPHTTHDE